MASSQGSSNGSGGSDGRSQNSAGKAKATCICGNNEGALCPVHPDHDPIAYDDDEVEAVPLCKKPKSEKDLAYLARAQSRRDMRVHGLSVRPDPDA